MNAQILTKPECEAMYRGYLRERAETDTVWFIHKDQFFNHGRRGIQVMNNNELRQQAKQWRKHKRAGKIQMLECNNKTVEVGGETYYMLVLQMTSEDDDMDMVALMLAGEMVSGCCYFFRNKHNRDAIFRFVNSL